MNALNPIFQWQVPYNSQGAALPVSNKMTTDTIKTENSEFVLARLHLAQAILEESDLLPGLTGYNYDNDKWWLHQRHEREALVIYLLLTCFDRLGQDKRFTTLQDWLNSKKKHHTLERNSVLDPLSPEAAPLDTARALADRYQSLYGVRNAFCQGIDSLPGEARQRLFSSVRLSFNPKHGMHGPNVSTPGYPLEDEELEHDLKLRYLYDKRNRFTHRLDQHHRSSTPFMSERCFPGGSSWAVMIRDSRLSYWGVHQEHVPLKSGGAYVYTAADWPFILFEVLYSAIEVQFDRTLIKLNFQVRFINSKMPETVGVWDGVEHSRLKDFHSLADEYWADR